jgi:hypothetical protein
MDSGKLVEVGSHWELFEKGGHYRRLYDLQYHQHDSEILEPATIAATA